MLAAMGPAAVVRFNRRLPDSCISTFRTREYVPYTLRHVTSTWDVGPHSAGLSVAQTPRPGPQPALTRTVFLLRFWLWPGLGASALEFDFWMICRVCDTQPVLAAPPRARQPRSRCRTVA
jgi:hypothetical protein